MNAAKIYDISLSLCQEMTNYPGDPPFAGSQICSVEGGDGFNLSVLTMGSHAGTHLDAPAHYFSGGLTVDRLSPEDLIGPAKVIEVAVDAGKGILPEHLEGKDIREGDRILFKTLNSQLLKKKDFSSGYTYLSREGAEFLARKKIRLVGIDYYSVDCFSHKDSPSHKTLLEKNIIILEGINLANVKSGEYLLIALPLKLEGCDGSPVRAVLLEK